MTEKELTLKFIAPTPGKPAILRLVLSVPCSLYPAIPRMGEAVYLDEDAWVVTDVAHYPRELDICVYLEEEK